MIHAWIDLVLNVEEAHWPNFYKLMAEIKSDQFEFKTTARHYPIPKRIPKRLAIISLHLEKVFS